MNKQMGTDFHVHLSDDKTEMLVEIDQLYILLTREQTAALIATMTAVLTVLKPTQTHE